ncbi:MAG: hypothetical protein QOH09_4368 [Pseudonocardiales bacterium]|jgi:hypothetical protein|nr:hypothetical protein [Pseudonocardiales bacterium]
MNCHEDDTFAHGGRPPSRPMSTVGGKQAGWTTLADTWEETR